MIDKSSKPIDFDLYDAFGAINSIFPASQAERREELHQGVIKIYGLGILFALLFWLGLAALTYWVAAYNQFYFGFADTLFWTAPTLALSIIIGAIAHHSFRNPKDSDAKEPLVDTGTIGISHKSL